MPTKKKRDVFGELVEGISTMSAHRKGKVTLKTHAVESRPLPKISPRFIRETRERLNMSRGVFSVLLCVNSRTLESWEQGRSKPNDQAVALLLLVRRHPETLKHLEELGVGSP